MSAYRKIPITKMSMATLLVKRSEAEKRVQELKSQLISHSLFESESIRVEKAKRHIDLLNAEISVQRERREVSSGLMGALFGVKDLPQSAIHRIAALRDQINSIEQAISKSADLVSNQKYIKGRISDTSEWLDKLRSRIEAIETKEAKQQSLKNKAAESTKTKRQIAKGVKRSLADNKECPYCGAGLSSATHADHIYPLAKGGESTKKNMVLVCFDCNSKKSSLTLRAFIIKYNLDRDTIERRLEALGKDF
jgi:5-methylcytosine-specific restriction endonuclease McrA